MWRAKEVKYPSAPLKWRLQSKDDQISIDRNSAALLKKKADCEIRPSLYGRRGSFFDDLFFSHSESTGSTDGRREGGSRSKTSDSEFGRRKSNTVMLVEVLFGVRADKHMLEQAYAELTRSVASELQH